MTVAAVAAEAATTSKHHQLVENSFVQRNLKETSHRATEKQSFKSADYSNICRCTKHNDLFMKSQHHLFCICLLTTTVVFRDYNNRFISNFFHTKLIFLSSFFLLFSTFSTFFSTFSTFSSIFYFFQSLSFNYSFGKL